MTFEEYDALPIATWLIDRSYNVYYKPTQDESYHLDQTFINIFTGQPIHFSRVYNAQVTSPNQIPW